MRSPARLDIEALVAFLPMFTPPFDEALARQVVPESDGSTVYAPYIVYDESISEFFRLVGKPPWGGYAYNIADCERQFEEVGFIERASIPELAGLLMYCERGERFGDGHWSAMIREGKVYRILLRLDILLNAL